MPLQSVYVRELKYGTINLHDGSLHDLQSVYIGELKCAGDGLIQ